MNNVPIALITGANRGLGFEVCRQLASRGYLVMPSARELVKAETAAAQIAQTVGPAHAVVLDTGDPASIQAAHDFIASKFGRLDVLVNNAGGNFDAQNLATTISMEYVRETLDLNLVGAWRVTQTMLPLLRRSSHPRIVNVSSGAGAFESEIAFGLQRMGGIVPAYAISKVALTALTVKLAAELAGSGILINAVCPGWTATYPGAAEKGARPVADGAAGIVWAATLPDNGPSGGFFRDGRRLPW